MTVSVETESSSAAISFLMMLVGIRRVFTSITTFAPSRAVWKPVVLDDGKHEDGIEAERWGNRVRRLETEMRSQ